MTCTETSTGTLSWIVSPDLAADGSVPPDYATGLASVGQSFMDAIPTVETYTWPWLWEGLSFAFKSGSFDGAGQYTMGPLADPEGAEFRAALAAGTLLPLTDLVALERTRTEPPTGTWFGQETIARPQSSMLMNYLFRTYPSVIESLFAAIDAGTVALSEQAFDFVLDAIDALDDTVTGRAETEAKLNGAYGATQ